MVISFQSKGPRNRLLKKGFVFTVRLKRRKRTGHDWMNFRRGGSKIANVLIFELAQISHNSRMCYLEQLAPFTSWSGFLLADEWITEIVRLNRGKFPKVAGWLYLVVIVK